MTFKIGKGNNKFQWGLNIDDIWKYAGLVPPRSTVIPYLLSVRTREGPFSLPKSDGDDTRRSVGVPPRVDGRDPKALVSFLKKSGVDFVRCWFQWNFFEQDQPHLPASRRRLPTLLRSSPSAYLFPLDELVSRLDDAGIGIIAVLGAGYSRFLPRVLGTDHLDGYVRRLTESSMKIVRHYKDKVKVWQIENEPNWWKAHYTSDWRKGAIWLSQKSQEPILSALHDIVRSESPRATIMINLEAEEKKTRWKFYSKYADVLGLDFYPNYTHPVPIDAKELKSTASLVRKETGSSIFVMETGYPTGPAHLGYDEKKQCRYIRSACEQAFTCDAITGLGWFRFSDSYWKSFPPQENNFGLLTKEGRRKLGWGEYLDQIRAMR